MQHAAFSGHFFSSFLMSYFSDLCNLHHDFDQGKTKQEFFEILIPSHVVSNITSQLPSPLVR